MNSQFKIFFKNAILFLITVYQKTLSRDHGPLARFYPYGFCRFYPTCSEYAKEAIKKRGVARGALRALWRVLRCNPVSKGGYDPVRRD